MSLILDALNKADRERQNNEAPPGINTVHDIREFEKNQAKWLYPALAILILVIVAMLGWWFFHSKPEKLELPPQLAPNIETPAPKSKSIPGLPKPVLVEKEKPSTINKSAVNELYNKQVEDSKNDANTQTLPEKKPVVKTELVSERKTSEPKVAVSDSSPASTAKSTPINPPVTPPSPPPEVRSRLSDYSDIGKISDLPWSVINVLPSLNYSSHIYSKGGNTKQIVINNQSKGEGQSLSENIKVENILRDGVILEFQGHKFKLSALNSWVNI